MLDRSTPVGGPGPDEGRIAGLDGVRGLALIAVLLYHAAPASVRGGFLGVEMFFVLSGFLLTTLLQGEHRRTLRIDRAAYAWRRVRRIVPALAVLLTVLTFIGLFLPAEDAHRLGRDIVASAFGVTNWHLIREGSSYFGQLGRPPLVRHLWSIAVEVQAYVVLPFVALAIARRTQRFALWLLGSGIAASALLMAIVGPTRAYYGTDTRIGALLTGALLAVVLASPAATRFRLSQGTLMTSAGGACVVLVTLFAFVDAGSAFLYPTGFLIAQAATAVLIVSATRLDPVLNVFAEPSLRWLGARSYGIYLWHWPIVALVRPGIDVDWNPTLVTAGGITLATVLGDLSYRFVERPFMTGRIGSWPKMPVRAVAVTWSVALFVLIALLAQSAPTDPIAASLAEGERALAEQDEAPSYGDDPPAVTQDAATEGVPVAGTQGLRVPAAAAALPVPKRTGPKAGTVKVTAIGDSVMLGAAARLKERFGSTGYVDAKVSRQYHQSDEVIKALRKKKRLAPVLIVHLGNNGPVKSEHIKDMLAAAKGVKTFLFVTVRVTKPWQNDVNEAIKDADKNHKEITLVNWYRASEGHRDWFYSDGTHVNAAGATAYSNLLHGAVPKPKPKAKPKKKPPPASPTPAGLLPDLSPGI